MKFRALILLTCVFNTVVFAREAQENAAVSVKALDLKQSKMLKQKSEAYKNKNTSMLMFRSSLDEQLAANINKTIGYLEKLAREQPKKSSPRLKFLTKIINLHFEQAIFISMQESHQYDQAWDTWSSRGQKGPEPKYDDRVSRSHWMQISKLSQSILAEYPKADNADLLMYNDAIAKQYMNLKAEAAATLQSLIAKYPNSKYFHEAHYSLGEYYFDIADFKTAIVHFTQSMNPADVNRYGWAFFKIAWCNFNLGEYQNAVNYWKKAISLVDSKLKGTKKGDSLREATLRDLMAGFIELKASEKVIDDGIEYYKQNGGQEYIGMFLKKLAIRFNTDNHKKEAFQAWQKLLAIVPQSKEAFEATIECIDIAYNSGSYDYLWKKLEDLFRSYNRNSEWAKANHKDDVEDALKKIPILVLYYPKSVHLQAQKTNDMKIYDQARKGYELYFKLYPKTNDYAEIMEYYGDIYYIQKQYDKAGAVYSKLVAMGKDKAVVYDENGKVKLNIHNRSAKNMLDAYSKDFLPELEVLLKTTPDFKKEPKPISAKAKTFISACERYVAAYPEDAALAKSCDIHISEIYYRSSQKQEAKKFLIKISNKYSAQKEGAAAAEDLIVLSKDNQAELYETANKLIAIKAYQTGPLGVKLNELIRGIELERIAQETSKKKRAELYEKRAEKYPNDRDADKFLYNAANDYMSSGNTTKARLAYVNLVTRYPKSKVYVPTLLILGKLFDKIFDFKKAILYYSLYAAKAPTEKEAPGAEERACELAILQDYVSGWEQCKSFVTKYPQVGVAIVERLVNIGWIAKNYSWMTTLIKWTYMKMPINQNQKILAQYKIYQTASSDEEKRQARQNILQIGVNGTSGEATRYVAEMNFQKGEAQYAKQMDLKLSGGSVEKLQQSIQTIAEGLTALENAYGPTLATQDSYWGVAVFYKLATAYEAFARMLDNPPAIDGVNKKELKEQLKGSIDQVLGKSKEYFATGLGVAKKFNVYNSWVPLLIEADLRLKNKPHLSQSWVIVPDLVGGVGTKQQMKLLE